MDNEIDDRWRNKEERELLFDLALIRACANGTAIRPPQPLPDEFFRNPTWQPKWCDGSKRTPPGI